MIGGLFFIFGRTIVGLAPFLGAIFLVAWNETAFSMAPLVLIAGAVGSVFL